MKFFIGIILMMLGGILFIVTDYLIFFSLVVLGAFVFLCIKDEAMFYDYAIPNSNERLFRKR